MKKSIMVVSAAALALQICAGPSFALSDEEKTALAAAAILGVAALAHNQNHYHEGYAPKGAEQKAAFERGYRDGVHNEPYDSRHSSMDYGQGYDAGHKERENRLAHKSNNVAGTKVPHAALKSCVEDAASAMSVAAHDVHPVKAGQEGSDTYYIEVASGHRHLVCQVNSQGQIFDTRYGRL